MYILKPTCFFLEQLDKLESKSRKLILKKLEFIKSNPFRYKRLKGHDLFLFRIRFKDNLKDKRLIYFIDGCYIKLVCILDRKNDYKNLRSYLNRLE